jgi:hypothetical protein
MIRADCAQRLDFASSPSGIAARIVALTALWKSQRLLIAQKPYNQPAS